MMTRSATRKLKEEEESQTEPKCRNGVKVESDPEISAKFTTEAETEFQNIPQQHQDPFQDPVTQQPDQDFVLTEQAYNLDLIMNDSNLTEANVEINEAVFEGVQDDFDVDTDTESKEIKENEKMCISFSNLPHQSSGSPPNIEEFLISTNQETNEQVQEENQQFQCTLCASKFIDSIRLDIHYEEVHETIELSLNEQKFSENNGKGLECFAKEIKENDKMCISFSNLPYQSSMDEFRGKYVTFFESKGVQISTDKKG